MSESRSPVPDVSVVMAVYAGVHPDHLVDALNSLVAQSLPPVEIVVAEDGWLPTALRDILDSFAGDLPLTRVRLPTRRGSAVAKQVALQRTTSELVAVADADDISLPNRLIDQRFRLLAHDLDLIGSAMEEFDSLSGKTLGVRRPPESHADISRVMRTRNPFNHPSVMYRRKAALSAGGYRNLPLLEDYDLWARMLRGGARLGNAPETLVRFRGGPEALRRRRSAGAARSEWRLQRNLFDYGLISRVGVVRNLLVRNLFRALPLPVMKLAYRAAFLSAPRG